MKRKIFKKGEMYIDTAIMILISLFILYITISLFSFFNKYQDIKNLSDDLLKYCANNGYTSTADVEDKYKDLLKTYGLSEDEDKDAVKISFSGTEYYQGSKVQLDDKVQLTVQAKYRLKLLSSDGFNIYTMSVTNAQSSNRYWEAEDEVNLISDAIHSGIIPEGATYFSAAENKTYVAGEEMPLFSQGDIYAYNDYEYRYNMVGSEDGKFHESDISGWSVYAINDLEHYDRVLSKINGKNLVNMDYTFISSPVKTLSSNFRIPSTVTSLHSTFEFSRITVLPQNFKIPEGVKDMSTMFYFSDISELPASFTIPNTVTEMYNCFYGCLSLKKLPDDFTLSNNCKNLDSVFQLSGLKALPENFTIPYGVTSINDIFAEGYSLAEIPINFSVPKTVTDMSRAFQGILFTGNITINCNPLDLRDCFADTKNPIHILGDASLQTKYNLSQTSYNNNVTFDNSKIELTNPNKYTEYWPGIDGGTKKISYTIDNAQLLPHTKYYLCFNAYPTLFDANNSSVYINDKKIGKIDETKDFQYIELHLNEDDLEKDVEIVFDVGQEVIGVIYSFSFELSNVCMDVNYPS